MNAHLDPGTLNAVSSQEAWSGQDRRQSARHIWFLNAAFDRISADVALKRIAERPASAPFAFVVTPNVDHLVRLQGETVLARLYAQAWLTVCDSRVLELIAELSGQEVDVTTGSDLTEALFDQVIDPSEPVVVIGGGEGVIEGLKARYGLTDIRWHQPPMGLKSNPEAIAECAAFVAANPCRFSFLCVGSPQQELVAEACLERGDCTGVGLCVGASLDFLSGKARRAPRWMQTLRLEWMFRLMAEPRRMWKRYLVDGSKVVALWWGWRRARTRLRDLEQDLLDRL
ncbi:WecB/TagA/CpsF family glycosyltransferase [Oceanicaulis sp. LC35]|uniref:WecB/TagA/CpsF family glycosyltransferase n=1 Tax=Oceanicaulis sp. LC35 TaxID=3349635 RepID=UPI003F82A465